MRTSRQLARHALRWLFAAALTASLIAGVATAAAEPGPPASAGDAAKAKPAPRSNKQAPASKATPAKQPAAATDAAKPAPTAPTKGSAANATADATTGAPPIAPVTTAGSKDAAGATKTAADDKPAAPAAIDLFPKSVLAGTDATRLLAPSGRRQGTETPRGAVFSLGDDSDWRVQAGQIGVMTGLFTVLAALCNGGACMLGGNDGPAKPPSRDGEVLRKDRKSSW